MIFGIFAASAISMMASEATVARVPLDGLIGFSDPKLCEPSDNFMRLLTTVMRAPGNDRIYLGKPVVPRRFKAALGRPTLTRTRDGVWVTLPLNATWHGLPVLWVKQFAPKGGDTPSFSVRFGTASPRVRTALNAEGLAIPAKGSRVAEDAYEITVGIKRERNFTDFSCEWG